MPNLIVERGREKGQSFELPAGGSLVIGRDPAGAQVVIHDPAASRRHFQVATRNGKWYVADLGSKNFTFVNEEKCEKETELTNGDRIQVGETVFTFNDEQKGDDKAAGLNGKEIGGFRILNRLGRGGMGTVYKAKQISLNRLVALKFLSPKLAKDPAFVEKFFAEARAAAQLNHPNVVQVFDVGTLGGAQYFSMEFMEGGCVQDLLSAREDSRLPWQEALPLILDAVRGLVFAEKRGIIHRDIKPDNLMLTSEQKVKIGDLGLATSAEGGGEKGIFGTPHFIAPEQAQGREVTHAADLYSLGATIYRMVGGKTPFTGNTVKEILKAQINDPHQPIPQLVPDFPPELAAIIDKLMAKKVADRYQSATKLLEDLEAFQLAHQIELAGGVRSRKPFYIALGVLGVALVSVIIYVATREKEVEYRPGSTVTIVKTVGPDGPVKTEAEIQKEYDDAAERAVLLLKLKEAPLGNPSLEKKSEWDEIQKEYDALRAKHPKAKKHIADAETRAADIRKEIERLEELQRTVVAAATKWWTETEGGLKDALAAGRWGDAVRTARAVAVGDDLKKHEPYLPKDRVQWLRSIPETAVAELVKKHAQEMEAANGLFDSNRIGEALDAVAAWQKSLTEQAIDDARVKNLLTQAADWRTQKAEAAQKRLTDQLEADKEVFYEIYRGVRHWSNDPADMGGPVYAFRFAEAAAALRKGAEGRVKTYLYADRVAAKAAQLDAAQAAWDEVVRSIGEKKLWAPGEALQGLPGVANGAKVTFDPDRPPTATEAYLVISVSGGSTKRTLTWDSLTPQELFKSVLAPRLADRITPELALKLAHVFAELGDGDSADLLYARSKAPPEQAGWLLAELRAIGEYQRLVERVESAPGEVVRGVDAWRKTHYRTDFSVLVDGRPATEASHVFSDEDMNRLVDHWGQK